MSRYEITDPAAADLTDIWNYIAADNPDSADDELNKLYAIFTRVAAVPGIGRRRSELVQGLRSFPASNYVIFYHVTEEGISIVRVLHGARSVRKSMFR